MPHAIHTITDEDGNRTLTVYAGQNVICVNGDHPHYDDLLTAALNGEPVEKLVDLADLSGAVERRFERLSERVTVEHGRVYFDGDEVRSAITEHIVRCLNEPDAGDWRPLVLFMENIAANPNTHSREQAYDWLAAHDFTVTRDGKIVGYKGVHPGEGGRWQSGFSGTALVNGVEHTGRIPQGVGDVVEMPRSRVAHNPSAACSTGLHVGTFEYAKAYAQGALLRVLVDPRDVVSVPTDAHGEKVRVCRYRIDAVIDAPETRAVAYDLGEDEPSDECCQCGDDLDRDGECWNEDCPAF